MISLMFVGLLAIAHGELSLDTDTDSDTDYSTCESYDEKYASVDWNSSLTTLNDPCFGYTTSCCEATAVTGGCCYWKQTAWCLNSRGGSTCDEDDGEDCPACCESTEDMEAECTPTMAPTTPAPITPAPVTPAPVTPAPVTPAPVTPAPVATPAPVVEATPAPTMHSAKKWTMLHPDYQGGDGELLWNIYYGEYAVDVRFDAFRANQMWDADVIRPFFTEEEVEESELAHQVLNAPEVKATHSNVQWVLLVCAAVVILAAAGLWYKQKGSQKMYSPVETQSLIGDRKESYVF